MKTYLLYFTFVICFLCGCVYEAESSDSEVTSRELLSYEIRGSVIYSKDRYIYKVVIGKWTPIKLAKGEYARWSPDGNLIAVYDSRKIYIMDSDGNNRKLITDEAWQGSGCPIEFYSNGHEIIFTKRKEKGLWTVDINNGTMRKLLDLDGYPGEFGISSDGTRIAFRLTPDLYAFDMTTGKTFVYLKNCGYSAGISPDGKWLMNNTNNGDGSHESMNIRSWDGDTVKILRAAICQPDGEWGHHTWSNHNDYITAQGGLKGESYVVKLSANRGTRVSWGGKTVYPDLYIEEVISGSKLPSPVEIKQELAVLNVNKTYNRLNSRLVIRHILIPTRANLDFSAYDSNVLFYNPSDFRHRGIDEKKLSDLHFQGILAPESLADQISSTPITSAEIASPMIWLPMIECLINRDFDKGYALAKAGWDISENSWGDDDIAEPFQEISRVYIHKNAEIWVKIEFKPWVKFLKDIDDEDKDGFPELYGKLNPEFYDESIIKYLLEDYTKVVLSRDEIINWGYEFAYRNYDKYATVLIEPEKFSNLIEDQIKDELKKELGDLTTQKSMIIIRGRPFGETIYIVLIF